MKTIKAFGVGIGAMLLLADAVSIDVMAACSNSAPPAGASVTCTGTGLSPVIAQTGSTNVAVDIATGAAASFVHATSAVAFSIEQASSVTNGGDLSLTGSGGSGTMRGAVLLGTGNGNQLINATGGMIRTAGAFNDGIAANGSGNTLTNQGSITTTGPNAYGMTAAWGQTNIGQLNNTLNNTGSIATSGSNARAASILGGNGTVDNSGTLSTTGPMSTTAYLQGNNDHLINSGSITATGAASDAVFSNTAGSNFTALIENRAGGRIVAQGAIGIRTLNGNTTIVNAGLVQSVIGSAIAMGNGNDSLILQTGSTIIGSADGGAGGNTVTLQGAGTADNAFTRFQTLLMQGTLWNWAGSGSFESARVQAGTLNLTGTLGAPASVAATVDAGATLQANAQNLPQSVVDNGLVRFAQQIDGSYTGLISGSGAVDKTGVGTLALAPAAAGGNTYAGGTAIEDGTLAIGADSALGAPSGGIAFNGGTLRLDQNLNLAATRAIVLNAAGGTIDMQSFNATLAQPVTGNGALTKTGSGSLSMTNISTYSGTTTVVAGTLAVGDAAHPGAALAGGGGASVAAGATLGGYGSVNGAVANSGTIAVANALAGFAGAPNGSFTVNGSLTNAALVRIGGESAGNQLRVAGAYVGQNGTIALNTVAGADDAASDRLVIDGGTGSGSTALQVANIGGTGAQTAANGIRVVQALNGATTVPSAFRLAAPFKAGAFTYYLAKGGVTSGSANDWFLRNTVAPLPATPAEPPTPGAQALPGVPLAAVGTPPLPPAPPPGADPIPLYRPEVPIYAAIPGVVRQIGMLQIDTFHDRQGDPSLLTGNGTLPAAWARAWGNHSVLSQDGAANPEFDGSIFGIQAGHDLYADTRANGARNHYGLFIGFARATGDVEGFAFGTPNLDVGHLAINAYSLGGYWTHVGASGWYTDAVLMGSSLTVDPLSHDGVGATTHGDAVTGSLEGGLPIPLGARMTVEPQAQLIWQHLSIDDLNDGVSSVTFSSGNTFVARIGVRLQGSFDAAGMSVEPYLRFNVLRSFGPDDSTTFGGGTVIGTIVGQTAAQIGAGVVARVGRAASVFATASWLTNLGGSHQRTVGGNAGVRWTW